MHLKDYYKTLELAPSASLQEIKKAYRKLAQQYHPDKNTNDPYAEANFNEIKEAYETLSNPAKKDEYLQLRWYNRATGNTNTQEIITPVNILKKALEFEKYTSTLDVFRMHREGLFDYMNELLNDETISKLLQFNEPDINKQVALTLLKPVSFLKSGKAQIIADKLVRLTASDAYSRSMIEKAVNQVKQKEYWEKYRWIFVLLITVGICLLIKFISD